LQYALSFLPGGVKTAMQLAWLSRDERVRDVARSWLALGSAERDQTDIEELCDGAGIRDGDYLGAVMGTAFELNVDISAVIGGITRMPDCGSRKCRTG
jgi:hypothetical protein